MSIIKNRERMASLTEVLNSGVFTMYLTKKTVISAPPQYI